jgi:hypothetical protein
MGSIFSSGPTTVVSSTVYNLAGDVNKRSNFLKTTVISNVVGESTMSMGESINRAYLNGPAMKLRSFARWAEGSADYNHVIGAAAGRITTGNSLDVNELARQIPHDAGYTVSLQQSDLGPADSAWWADQYVAEHHPERLLTDWHADYDVPSNTVTITYADHTTETFHPVGLDMNARYIFAAYTLITGKAVGAVTPGNTVSLGSAGSFPATAGWTLDSNLATSKVVNLRKTVTRVVSYSDGRPVETSTTVDTTSMTYAETHTVYERTDFKGIDLANPTRTYSIRSIMSQDQTVSAVAGAPSVATMTDTAGGGVTQTITITTVVESARFARSYRIDTQDITNNTISPVKVFIYQLGAGNAVLDAMFNLPVQFGSFFPYIPIRINNQFVSESYLPDVYAIAKKAYKKSVGGQLDDTIAQIADNASIGDIDYTYAVFGVSLNVAEVKCKSYIYTFFKAIMESQSYDSRAYERWKTDWNDAKASWEAYGAWLRANWGTGTDNVATMPQIRPYPSLPQQSVSMYVPADSPMNYNIQMFWNSVEESTGAGMHSPDHAVGDMWWVINPTESFDQTTYFVGDSDIVPYVDAIRVESVTLYSQVSANNWTALTLRGLVHRNLIYGGNAVFTSAVDALNDREESGFIIPLQEDIYRTTPLVDATQMATACCYLVFNCYKVVKKKWYQTGLFTVIIIIVIIIITWLTWGSGTGPASAGLLGTNAGVGAALGFTGTLAIVVGAIVNAVAAMVLVKLIGVAADKIFGEKIGSIVGAIAAVVAIVVGTSYANSGNWTTAMSSLTSPSNLLQLTSAVAGGVSGYIGSETQDIIKETSDMLESYNEKMADVQDAYQATGMTDLAQFDPMQLTDAGAPKRPDHIYEPAASFLNRTLMTGSDIADLQNMLISQFTSLTLDPNQNLVT